MKLKRHYAWVICGSCLLLHFCAYGMTTASFYTHMPYIREQLGFTNTQTSFISTIRSLSTLLVMPLAVRYYERLSLRRGISLACGALCAAYVIFAYSETIFGFYFGAVLMGVTFALGTMIPISLLLRNWFHDRRAMATGIATCGSSIAAAVSPPIVTAMVEGVGLRSAFLLEAAFGGLCILLMYFLLRDAPKEKGLSAYGEGGHGSDIQERQFSQHGLGSHGTALLMAVIFLAGACGTPGAAHLTIHYNTAGYESMQAAAAVSFYGVVMAFSKFGCGVAADRFGAYRINYVFMPLWIGGNFLNFLVNGSSQVILYTAALMIGAGVPMGTVGINIWTGDLSSEAEYAKNIQRGQMLFALGGLICTPVPGIIADLTGSYGPAYVLFAAGLTAATIIIQFTYHSQLRHTAGRITTN